MAIDLTPIIQTFISLLALIITAFVIPWIKAKTTAQNQETLEKLTRTLVYAAEQLYGSQTGSQKLSYVQSELEKRGYTLNIAAIEAAVREMNFMWSLNNSAASSDTQVEETVIIPEETL